MEDCCDAVTTIGDLIFSNEAEAILKGLDPTDEVQRKKVAKSPLGKVNWKGTYQSSCDLTETPTEQFCEEITVPKEIVATLLLAAGGKGGVSVGVAEVAPAMISSTGTERRKRKEGVGRGYRGTLIRRYHFRAMEHQKLIIEAKLSTVSLSGFFPIGIPTRETETVVGSSGERTFTTL